MRDVLGIVSFTDWSVFVEGMMDTRSAGAISFLGRYRLIDFTLSNFTNSGIDDIQIYVKSKPRSLIEHVQNGNYNINSKRGGLKFLFSTSYINHSIYNNDISCYIENMQSIEESDKEYVVLSPAHLVYHLDLNEVINAHKQQGNDITCVYALTDKAKDEFVMHHILDMDKNHRVKKVKRNLGKYKNQAVSLDILVMKKSLFVELINRAHNTSSLYTLEDIANDHAKDLKIYGYKYKGIFANITSLKAYYDASIRIKNIEESRELFNPLWPIHTKTNDSCPTLYFKDAKVVSSVVANGCKIAGTVINSIIGRNVIVEEGAVVKDSVILPSAYIGAGSHLTNVVVDKYAEVKYVKELEGTKANPLYVKRRDRI